MVFYALAFRVVVLAGLLEVDGKPDRLADGDAAYRIRGPAELLIAGEAKGEGTWGDLPRREVR